VLPETTLQKLAPYQNFFNQSIPEIYPRRGTDEYNAMYLSTTQRIGSNLSLLASYVWSKSMDNVPDTNAGSLGNFGTSAPQDPNNAYSEWAVSSYDQPSRLRVGYHALLPFGDRQRFDTHNGFLNELIGDISTGGIVTVASGYPNFVTLGPAIAVNSSASIGNFVSFTPVGTNNCTKGTVGNFCTSAALPYGYVLRPDLVPGVPLINPHWKDNPFGLNGGNFTPYLNPAAFGCTLSGTTYNCAAPGSVGAPRLGNAPRTLTGARSPREFMFDARVLKGFHFGDRYLVNISATLNNAFNHPVYFAANSTANDPMTTGVSTSVSNGVPVITSNFAATTFGKFNPNTANLSRVIRVGAEFVF
jgi:hypothetical protein